MDDPPIFNNPSHSQEACDHLPLPQGHDALVGDERTLAHGVLVTADHAIRCHTLQEERGGGACLLRHPQGTVDLTDAETVAGLVVVHGEHAQDCPLIGGTEGLAVGDGGEHGSVVVNKGNLQDGMGGCDPSRNNHSQSRMMDQNEPLPCVCSHQRSAASLMQAMGSSSKSSASTMHSTSSPPLGIQWRWSLGRKKDTNTSTLRGLVVCWMNWVISLWW